MGKFGVEVATRVDMNLLGSFHALRELNLTDVTDTGRVLDISAHPHLCKLVLDDIEIVESLGPVPNPDHVRYLTDVRIKGCENLQDITALGACTNMSTLYLSENMKVDDVSCLHNHPNLVKFETSGLHADVGGLITWPRLKHVNTYNWWVGKYDKTSVETLIEAVNQREISRSSAMGDAATKHV